MRYAIKLRVPGARNDAFKKGGSVCAIDAAFRECLLEAGCDAGSLPPRLCARNSTEATTPPAPRLESLEWLEESHRGSCGSGCLRVTMVRAPGEGNFGLGLSQNTESWGAVTITLVVAGSAAARAGVAVGDSLVRLGDLLRTQEASLADDFLPLLRSSMNLTATFQRASLAPKELLTLNLCELLPCRNESTPCFGSNDDYICACPVGTEGRACREPQGERPQSSSLTPLRVALVLSGQPRFYRSESYESMHRLVIEPYSSDVFFHCWWSSDMVGEAYSVAPWTGLRRQEAVVVTEDVEEVVVSAAVKVEDGLRDKLLALYQPKAYEFQAPRTKPGGAHNEGFTTVEDISDHREEGGDRGEAAAGRTAKVVNAKGTYLARNLPDILYSVFRAGMLKYEWEREHGFKYDVVVKSRFDAFLGNVPIDFAALPRGPDRIYVADATRLRQADVDDSDSGRSSGLLSVKRSTVTMGREDCLQISSSRLHDLVYNMAGNQTALIDAAQTTHVVRLLREHLLNFDLLGTVVDNPLAGISFGLIRGDGVVDAMTNPAI